MMKLNTAVRLFSLSLIAWSSVDGNDVVVDADENVIRVCRGEEITIDLSDPEATRPKVYLIDTLFSTTAAESLPPNLTLNRRTGIINGLVRDSGFRNVYDIQVMGIDPVDQSSNRRSVRLQVDWCQGTHVSRFHLVDSETNEIVRVLRDGDTVQLSCLGGFTVEAETSTETAIESQSEGDLINSVQFIFDGREVQLERVFPFSLGGDLSGDYMEFPISTGTHRLKAIPYSYSDVPGESKEITFSVVE